MNGSPATILSKLFERPDPLVDMVQAAAALARIEYPDLQAEPCLDLLDEWAQRLSSEASPHESPEASIEALNRLFFDQLGFRGNEQDYYDPRNSFINDVLERRTGIPISLSALYIELGRRVGMPLFGVGLPAHFLVKYADGEREIFIDPFYGGEIRDRAGCGTLLNRIVGKPVTLRDEHFAAIEKRMIVLRMCNNLRTIYLRRRCYRQAVFVLDAILCLAPDSPEDRRQRARLNWELGRRTEALADLEAYLRIRPNAPDSERMRDWSRAIRTQSALRN